MDYSLIVLTPLTIGAAALLSCLNIKIGFIVADKTRDTGFDAGFYFTTVMTLFAAEVAAGIVIGDYFFN